MTYDGRILNRATEELRRRSDRHQQELEARELELEGLFPRIREIDIAMRRSVISAIQAALSGSDNAAEGVYRQRDYNRALRVERAEILTANGYPADFMDREPLCPLCSDSGYTARGMCVCLRGLYNEGLAAALREDCGLPFHSFDEHRPELFSDEPYLESRLSPRQNIETVESVCRGFSASPERYTNLLFAGSPGTGKTFFASCIAYEFARQGFHAIYTTAEALVSRYDEERFRRDETAPADIERYEGCELLIIDDFGSEIVTSFSVTYLYRLINARINRRRSTLVITGLNRDALRQRYPGQLASRLEGDYTRLNFYGADIRPAARKNKTK